MGSIVLKQVTKRFGDVEVIPPLDLSIVEGEFVVFVGPSGCGKSTLLRLIAGLEDVTSGTVEINGQDATTARPAARGLAMVFQTYALYPHMSVRKNIAFPLKMAGLDQAEIDRKVNGAAQVLNLTDYLDRRPGQLSGGQRQRVAIGRAIVREPMAFLFDEPLSNLDAALRVQTRLEIAKLHHDIGTASMIYVTHDQVEAMTLADKIVLLRAGEDVQTKGSVAQVGTPMDLYHRPNSLFVAEFIGSPKMNVLPSVFLENAGGRAVVSVAGHRFEAAVDASHLQAGQAGHLGLRPEHMRLATSADSPNSLAAQIVHIEKLGEASLLYLDLGQHLPDVTLKLEGTTALAKGENVRLQVDATDLHLFDGAGDALRRTVELPV